jgi:hypothetical protein
MEAAQTAMSAAKSSSATFAETVATMERVKQKAAASFVQITSRVRAVAAPQCSACKTRVTTSSQTFRNGNSFGFVNSASFSSGSGSTKSSGNTTSSVVVTQS